MRHTHHVEHIRSVFSTLRAAAYARPETGHRAGQAKRFVTISREAGAGGRTLAADLAAALAAADPAKQPWYAWDHELVERVSAEHHIPPDAVAALEDTAHPWFAAFLAGLSSADYPDEFRTYRRVALTLRALAHAGRAVLVGRGGVFVTAGVPGGLHLRLVAPLADRVGHMAERLRVTPAEAAVRVREIDAARAAFYRRHWPGRSVGPEAFTLTVNTSALTDAQMVACLVPLITGADTAGTTQPTRREEVMPADAATRR